MVILTDEQHKSLIELLEDYTKRELLERRVRGKLWRMRQPYSELKHLSVREMKSALNGNYEVIRKGDYITDKNTGLTSRVTLTSSRDKDASVYDNAVGKSMEFDSCRHATKAEVEKYIKESVTDKLLWADRSRLYDYTFDESDVSFDFSGDELEVRITMRRKDSERKQV